MIDWENIVKSKKNVRSKDNFSIGNVVGNYSDYILVIDDVKTDHTYKIPKTFIETYNGPELFLNINHQDLTTLEKDFFKDKSNSFNDIFMNILFKGLSYMSWTIKVAIQNNDTIRIDGANKEIKLDIIDPSIFESLLAILRDNKIIKDNKITDFFKYIREAKEFSHKLSENELTVSILNKGKNAIILGKNANPSLSKLITKSDDIQINSLRKSLNLATDTNKEEKEK